MTQTENTETLDALFVGGGIMSATLSALLKMVNPASRIHLYEACEAYGQEASSGWNNAGTGHAGLCELSYTPDYGEDGEVDVSVAIDIYHKFEHSLQLWASAVRLGVLDTPADFINPVPHFSFVYGEEQVKFLRSRFKQMSAHHFFKTMEYTEDRETIRQWAPLILEGRDDTPVAMTRMLDGTDVNFGELASKMIVWLGNQENCSAKTQHKVIDLDQQNGIWTVQIKNLTTGAVFEQRAKFVFIGAGGGSLPLLQKSGIDEAKGFGGFPIGGQWLVSEKPELIEQHQAKVYGMSPGSAPTMAVPHLDTRVIEGKKSLLFGPYASWTTKFLHRTGRLTDLPGSIRPDNILSLLKVGIHNIPLVQYLIQQGTQSFETRMNELRNFYPAAKREDWKLIDAGIRVQAIKKEDGDAGIVHFGTEVVHSADNTVCALLGASPGASVSANIALDVLRKCFSDMLETAEMSERLSSIIPAWNLDMTAPEKAEQQAQLHADALKLLQVIDSEN